MLSRIKHLHCHTNYKRSCFFCYTVQREYSPKHEGYSLIIIIPQDGAFRRMANLNWRPIVVVTVSFVKHIRKLQFRVVISVPTGFAAV